MCEREREEVREGEGKEKRGVGGVSFRATGEGSQMFVRVCFVLAGGGREKTRKVRIRNGGKGETLKTN